MASPVASNSSSINWRDPDTTTPKAGRLQGDVKHYQYGATTSRDNPLGLLGPGGEPLCGIGIDLCGLTQTGPEPDSDLTVTGISSPPAGYENPLRINPDNNCLWLDQNTQPYFLPLCEEVSYPVQTVSGPTSAISLGPAMQLCWANDTGGPCVVKRILKVLNYVIDSPPPSTETAGQVDLGVSLPQYFVQGDITAAGEHTHTTFDVDINVQNGGAGDASHDHGATGTVTLNAANDHTHTFVNGFGVPTEVGGTFITSNQIMNANSARAGVFMYLDVGGFHVHVAGVNTNGAARGSMTYDIGNSIVQPGATHVVALTPMLAPTTAPDVEPYFAGIGQVQICYEITCLPPGASILTPEKC